MSLLKHPATIVSGLFTAVAAVFNIPFVDGVVLWAWSNSTQLFYLSSIASTVSANTPIPEQYATQALVATGILVLAKLLLKSGNDLEDSIEDS